MGVPSCKSVHARHRDGADCRHDPRKAPPERDERSRRLYGRLICLALWLLVGPGPAFADRLRIATYHAELSRDGPGLLLRDLERGDAQIAAAAKVVAAADADVLLLLGIDYDDGLESLQGFAKLVEDAGATYPHLFALPPNTGVPTGLDLDGDGRKGGSRDAQGYGRFSGQGGMAILSRVPIVRQDVRDFSGLLWRDLPGAMMPENMTAEVAQVQRLSTTAHWNVPLQLPGGDTVHLLGWHATPPVFDGPEDRNGRRNHDETALWLRLLEGALQAPPPMPPFVILGDANLDPQRGEGRPEALLQLLSLPLLRDPQPQGAAGPATADFSANGGPGRMRAEYVLPSSDLRVLGSGVLWPAQGDSMLTVVEAASRHRLVWVDLETD